MVVAAVALRTVPVAALHTVLAGAVRHTDPVVVRRIGPAGDLGEGHIVLGEVADPTAAAAVEHHTALEEAVRHTG